MMNDLRCYKCVGILGLLLSACSSSHLSQASSTDQTIPSAIPTAASLTTSPLLSETTPDLSSERAKTQYAVERSLGAECGKHRGDDLIYYACRGKLPAHIIETLTHLPAAHSRLTQAMRQRITDDDFLYVAVPGLGQRADFLAALDSLDGLWIRSFEGSDPNITVYLIFGPTAMVGPKANAPDITWYKLYRVTNNGAPKDVTHELLPPLPHLTKAERKRYGPYLKEKGDATDDDLKLGIYRLQYFPIMRWELRQPEVGEYEAPYLPQSDPRAISFGFGGTVHYGFLIWTGKRFELSNKIRYTQWYCLNYPARSNQPGALQNCKDDTEPNRDPYVIDDRPAAITGDTL